MRRLHGRERGGVWQQALAILGDYAAGKGHLDTLLERYPAGDDHALVMACFRDWLGVTARLEAACARQPRPLARDILRLALTELRMDEDDPEATGRAARIIHHAVEAAKGAGLGRPEQGFINAVLRGILRSGGAGCAAKEIAGSHPAWLCERWRRQFGEIAVGALLNWNQSPAAITVQPRSLRADDSALGQPSGTQATRWAGFFQVLPGQWATVRPGVESGELAVIDPFARVPVELLDPRPGERILDLCAAPGGKSRQIAARMQGRGSLVCVDKPGVRLKRLEANLASAGIAARCLGADLEKLTGHAAVEALGGVPAADGALLDVPCSNTGVIRRRPDVKLHLRPADIERLAGQQERLLTRAAELVRPGGRLVYSTCSIEPEENAVVVEAFLAANPRWQLAAARLSYPWECGHDGGGAFLLTHSAPR